MAITGIAPGASGTFMATPTDASGNQVAMPVGVIPVWTVLDSADLTLAPSVDGLSIVITVAATPSSSLGTVFTLSVSATLSDGTMPAGSADVPILVTVVPPSVEVASFVISQTV